MKTFSHLRQYLAEFFLEWDMFKIKVVEKIKIHILCSMTFPRKSHHLWENVEKYGGARETADDIMAARCMLDNKGYTRANTMSRPCTHTNPPTPTHICNTHCFSTTKMATRTRLSVTLYVYCLCCSHITARSSELIKFIVTAKVNGKWDSLTATNNMSA